MPSSTKSMTSTRNHQTSSEMVRSPNKGMSVKDVFLQQPAPSPRTEDWVLFPEDVVREKHSTHRGARSRQVRKESKPERPCKVSPTPHNKMESAIANAQQYIQSRNQNKEVNRSCSHRPTKVSSDIEFRKSVHKPLLIQSSRRLPTPDLSDLEEDDLWSCCATSEGSI